MMKLIYLFTLTCIVFADVTTNKWAAVMNSFTNLLSTMPCALNNQISCSLPNCPNNAATDATFINDFAAMVETKKCACLTEILQCTTFRCSTADTKTVCTTIANGLTNNSLTTCNINCNAAITPHPETVRAQWVTLAADINNGIRNCDGGNNKDCSGMLPDCPTSSNFANEFAAMEDSKKCKCLNQALQCAYSRCKPNDVRTSCVNAVNSLKNYGITACGSINCNAGAGFAGAIPSFAIIGSCLMCLLGIMWAH